MYISPHGLLPVIPTCCNNQVLPMCLQAVESVLSGQVQRAFAVVRPPGHHAECTRAMGFCFFNSVAASALVAHRRLGARRVLVLDWDVHHGELTPAEPPQLGTVCCGLATASMLLLGRHTSSGLPVPPLEICRALGPCRVLDWDVQQGEP